MKCVKSAVINISLLLIKTFWLDSWLKTVHYSGAADEFKGWRLMREEGKLNQIQKAVLVNDA